MWSLLIFGLIGVQAILAVIHPAVLIYVSLVVGALPVSFGQEGMLFSALGKMDLSAVRLLGLWLASCFVVLCHFERIPRYLSSFRFHFLFLAFCGVAISWSPSIAYGMRMFAKLSAPFLFLLLIMLMVSARAQLELMETLIFVSGVVLVTAAVAVKLAGASVAQVGLTIPGVGPSLFSAFLVVVGLLALTAAKYGNRIRHLALVAICCAAVLAAFTRITITAMFVGCAVILFMGFKGWARVLLPAVGLVGFPALFLFSETFKKRMFYGTDQITLWSVIENPSIVIGHLHTSGRSNAWGIVLGQFFTPSPFVGSGLGATQNYYYSQTSGIGVIHSEYVRLLSEVGVLGLVLFVIAALTYLGRLASIYQHARESDTARYALAAVGALVAYLIYIATDNGFDYVTGFGMYVFSLIGMAEKARELDDTAASVQSLALEAQDHSSPLSLQRATRRYPIVGDVA